MFRPVGLFALALALFPVPARAHHPHDVVDALVLSKGFANNGTAYLASAGSINVFVKTTNFGHTWRDARAGLVGRTHRALRMARGPLGQDMPYVISDVGGLQFLPEGEGTWAAPVQEGSFSLLDVASMPGGEVTVFYGTNYELFRSVDSGYTGTTVFESLLYPQVKLVAVAVSPSYATEPAVAMALNDGDVRLSTDGGASWTAASVPATPTSLTLSPNFHNDRTLWLGTWGGGLYRSIDAGQSYAPLNHGLADWDVNDVVVSPDYPATRHIWVATRNLGVFASANDGASFELSTLEVVKTDQTDNHYRSLALSPQYPAHPLVVCGTFEGIYASANLGMDWLQGNINPTRSGRLLQVSPDFAHDQEVYGAGYGAQLLVSENQGEDWEVRFTGFGAISSYSIAISPDYTNDNLIVVGGGEGVHITRDDGHSYERTPLPPFEPRGDPASEYNAIRGLVFSPNHREDGTIWATSNGGFYVSRDRGETWEISAQPIHKGWQIAVSPDFAADSTLFLSGPTNESGVARSVDGGRTWQETTEPTPTLALAVTPDFASSNELFVIVPAAGLMRSVNRGDSWEIASDELEGVYPTRIALARDFASNNTMVLATHAHGVYESTDRGQSWRALSPAGPHGGESLAIAPDYPLTPTIFLGTWEGIVRSTNRGQSWTLSSDVEIYDDARKEPWLWRGVWRRYAELPDVVNQGVTYARRAGSTISLPFVGRGMRLIGVEGPQGGRANVYVDDVLWEVVDAYAPQLRSQVLLSEAFDLRNGYHKVDIVVLGEADPRATDTVVAIDAVEVVY